MDKLTIKRDKWIKGFLSQGKEDKFYSCAIGQYLVSLGVKEEYMLGCRRITSYLHFPEQGAWLRGPRGYGMSQEGDDITFVSDYKNEPRIIELFKAHGNIDVTFTGEYPS